MKSSIIMTLIFLMSELASAKAIKATTLSDLDFGTGAPGDPAKQILPGTTETLSNASFQITGDNNRAYSLLLPTTATIKTGSGSRTDTITISNFISYPSGNGLLNNSGSQNVYVGATRAALKLSQMAGLYSGTYSITVVY